MAFTNALDSILWANKEDPNYFKSMVFPKCFGLSDKACRLTSKFGGFSIEEKQTVQANLLKSLDHRVVMLSVGHRLSPEDSN